MKRVFHSHDKCEEFAAGLWRLPSAKEKQAFVIAAAELMRDVRAFSLAMNSALREWPNSCEFNLTNSSVNHLAWLGHAGCFLATGSPESTTRLGWRTLSRAEQDAANAAAQKVLDSWLDVYCRRADYAVLPMFVLGV